jgi:hypothetical protein
MAHTSRTHEDEKPAYRTLEQSGYNVLEGIHKLAADDVLLFPSERRDGKSMSNNTILYALYRLGYHGRMTGHGFRGMASTILHEQQFNHDHIELQLAHTQRDAVSRHITMRFT